MSQRPTDTQPSRAAAAHGHGRDERARHDDANAGAGRQSVAERAANFRQGAPFLVERATLYDPEPPDPPAPPHVYSPPPPPSRLLPAALTLLGVVVVAGLAASILLLRNADVARDDEGVRRHELLADRARPPEGPEQSPGAQPNATTIAYDLTRRPKDAIVGAWRSAADDEADAKQSGKAPALPKRRPLPRRFSDTPAELPPEVITRPVAAAPPRHDAPEPRRRIADAEVAPGSQAKSQETADIAPTSEGTAASSPDGKVADGEERPGPNVVARVGRASESHEADGPAVEIPLQQLALPLRRPDPDMLEDKAEAKRKSAARARRARFTRMSQKQWRAMRDDPVAVKARREALYGDWFVGTQGQRP